VVGNSTLRKSILTTNSIIYKYLAIFLNNSFIVSVKLVVI